MQRKALYINYKSTETKIYFFFTKRFSVHNNQSIVREVFNPGVKHFFLQSADIKLPTRTQYSHHLILLAATVTLGQVAQQIRSHEFFQIFVNCEMCALKNYA